MRCYFLIIFLLLLSGIKAQIVVVDIKNKPIPYVEVLSNNKYFYTQTNLKGELNWNEVLKLNPTDTLFFQLITYESVYFIKSELTSNDTIRLADQIQDRIQEFQEFSVVSNNKKNKYQIIDVCFRSYQVNDDSVAYYLDGKGQWISKINKSRFDLLLKENRSLANKVIEKEDDNPDRTVNFGFSPSVPRPPFYYLPFQYHKDLTYRFKDSSNIELFIKDSIYVGNIETTKDHVFYTISDYDFVGTNKLLKNEINRIQKQITLIFRNYEGFNVKTIQNYDDLLYYKSYTELSAKHNEEKDYKRFTQVTELFFENVAYAQSINKKEIKDSTKNWRESNYTSEFWKTCDCELYEPPIRQLLSNLYER
ncbi:hypothetical protein ERX46_14745 [Brumimicrobium glaciale]|uniref:Uncharacterized protein n=1 Tax=Brumimicrobium glaciale TaxID=200475 RepID=A0A4Q4KIQ0_9FLAO|nr:hypothetical protein [Brumimicrobium glaciale]RYM32527.1 hypothetical protein ERX46_14745 [Brumimicrobium glaciale]